MLEFLKNLFKSSVDYSGIPVDIFEATKAIRMWGEWGLSDESGGFVTFLTGQWKLKDPESPLVQWFKNHGVYHPADIVHLVYKRSEYGKNNRYFFLPAHVEVLKEWWASQGCDPDNLDINKDVEYDKDGVHGISRKNLSKNDSSNAS